MVISIVEYVHEMYDTKRWELSGFSEFDSMGIPRYAELKLKLKENKYQCGNRLKHSCEE